MAKGELCFCNNIKSDFENYCRENHFEHIVFICDTNTERLCLPFFSQTPNVVVLPGGELSKNIASYEMILNKLIDFRVNKSSLIVNLGGGMISDIGGFAASTFMRGINFVNIPTTLLGMIDAAIGGKTGIDLHLNKNYLGTFALPEAIFVYTDFLKTLPADEFKAGVSEMIKTGIIANRLLFDKIMSEVPYNSLISLTAETKNEIIKRDFYDQNERQLLNFGHTLGHAYESYRLSVGSPVLHGFAIAKGMMAESRIAFLKGMITRDELNDIVTCVKTHTLQSEFTIQEFDLFSNLLFRDKKNNRESIVFSLPESIGAGRTMVELSLDFIKSSISNAQD